MFLPLGDSPNPRGVPFVTYALIAANVAVFVLISLPLSGVAADPRAPALREYVDVILNQAPSGMSPRQLLEQVSAYDLFVFEHGFRPAAPRLDSLLSSLFLHAGLMHLVGNMLFLGIYGNNVEFAMGHGRYLVAYIATGIGATLFHMAFDMSSQLPLIGASGAISGVLGFYFLWFPHNQVRMLILLFPFFFNTVTISARLLLGMYLVMDNLVPFLFSGGVGGGVAHGAHIGGFIGGVATAWFSNRRQLNRTPTEYAAADVPSTRAGSNLDDLVRSGDFAAAADQYFNARPETVRRSLSPESSLRLAEWLERNGHDRAALTAYRRHLRDYANDPTTAAAHVGAGRVQLDGYGQPTAAYQHFLDALDASPPPDVAAEAQAAIDRIMARQKRAWGARA